MRKNEKKRWEESLKNLQETNFILEKQKTENQNTMAHKLSEKEKQIFSLQKDIQQLEDDFRTGLQEVCCRFRGSGYFFFVPTIFYSDV